MSEKRKCRNVLRFECYDVKNTGTGIGDRQLGRTAILRFKPKGIYCELDKSSECQRIEFTLTFRRSKKISAKERKKAGNYNHLIVTNTAFFKSKQSDCNLIV